METCISTTLGYTFLIHLTYVRSLHTSTFICEQSLCKWYNNIEILIITYICQHLFRYETCDRSLTVLRQEHQSMTDMYELMRKHQDTLKEQHDL